jgi:hypothetical protein
MLLSLICISSVYNLFFMGQMELAWNNHPSVRQFIVMARFMC